MRRFIRELFAREKTDETFDEDFREVEGGGPPPSIYDSLIDGLEGEVAGLKSMVDFHERQANDLDTTLDHKREQLAVLRAHREEERREPPICDPRAIIPVPDGWKPGDPIPYPWKWMHERGKCNCPVCRAARGQT